MHQTWPKSLWSESCPECSKTTSWENQVYSQQHGKVEYVFVIIFIIIII